MELNVQTLYQVGGIVTVCAAGAAALTWYHHRNAPGLRAWTAALVLTSVGALLLRLRSSSTDVVTTLAADMTIIAGFAVMWASLRLFNQGRTDTARLILMVAGASIAMLVLYGALTALGGGRQAISIPFSLLLGVLALASSYELWRGRRHDGLSSRLPTALAFVGLGIARLARAAGLGLEVMGALPRGTAAASHPYALYATIVFILVITYGLVMMAYEFDGRQDDATFARR